MTRVRGSELVVEALRAEGVRYTFGIPGTHNIELYDALDRAPDIEPILVTDEQAASFLADGLARTSGAVGVLNVVPGAGVTHCLSGVAEAYLDNVPLVVLACGIRSDTGAAFQLHDIDQLAVLGPVTKRTFRIETADEIVPTIRRAFALARAGCPGPVAVEVPANLLMLTQEVAATAREWRPLPEAPPVPDPAVVQAAARMLVAARAPALYLGAGAAAAEGGLVELAERLGAPVATTISGKGVFPERHPLWLWNGFGAQAPRFVRSIMERCDCLLAIGCRFGEVATGSYGAVPPPGLIHVDVDPAVFHRNHRAELAVAADAAAFVRALLETLEGVSPKPELEREIAAGHAEVRSDWQRRTSRDGVTPWRLFDALQRHCREDAIYATDSGNGTFLAMEHLRLAAPRRFIGPIDFSCMGYSVPAAIGAAFAHPGRDVVALAGDGALLMTGLELITAAAYRAAPLVCVLRDFELGQIAQFQKIPLNRQTCTILNGFDTGALAAATGARYFRIARDHELDAVLPAALELTREGVPALVDVVIDYSEKTYFTRGVVKTNFWRLPWGDRLRMLARAIWRRLPGVA